MSWLLFWFDFYACLGSLFQNDLVDYCVDTHPFIVLLLLDILWFDVFTFFEHISYFLAVLLLLDLLDYILQLRLLSQISQVS